MDTTEKTESLMEEISSRLDDIDAHLLIADRKLSRMRFITEVTRGYVITIKGILEITYASVPEASRHCEAVLELIDRLQAFEGDRIREENELYGADYVPLMDGEAIRRHASPGYSITADGSRRRHGKSLSESEIMSDTLSLLIRQAGMTAEAVRDMRHRIEEMSRDIDMLAEDHGHDISCEDDDAGSWGECEF